MKLLQINITANWGSHGRIAEEIGQLVIKQGWESYIAYGRTAIPSQSHLIRIGSMMDERLHGFQSRLLDNHGLCSVRATMKFIKQIDQIKPDIIHLHNIHGYYLNYPILFDYLSKLDTPVLVIVHSLLMLIVIDGKLGAIIVRTCIHIPNHSLLIGARRIICSNSIVLHRLRILQ